MAGIDIRATEPVLLVEDDANDVLLLRRAFVRAQIPNPLQVVTSAEQAVEYLSGEGEYGNRLKYPLPTLVLLDLKLSGKHGFEVLRWVRMHPRLKVLRVIVLTSSGQPGDVRLAHDLGANSYLIKPVDFEQLVKMSVALGSYWLKLNEAPEV